ncbi:Gag polyprotein [Merluccius polli]|uniref:Gag polyprotein n=1 Tax=Merluccius polli TaxID=89951 RepID=A0AA47M7T1_MERPO|nr:Gag polyprotein [Merluccius polli]
MWPGTDIADGTRYGKVKFNNAVQSLPYSTKFDTATGPEYFRVIHDRQVRVCRMCIQPGHILRDCPEFTCFKCHKQGHYARECVSEGGRRREEGGEEERQAEGESEVEAEDGEAERADEDDGETASGAATGGAAPEQRGERDGGGGERKDDRAGKMAEVKYEKELTVCVELQGSEKVTAGELMKAVIGMCGGLLACRMTGERKYELTMANEKAKDKLLDGMKIGSVSVLARELVSDEMVVSFLNLPAYVKDEEILQKLKDWGVSPASPIKRRMWPGLGIPDGTRFLKVKFTDKVQSLPYSRKFTTALGTDFFRVIHDRQVKVCKLCIKPGHILRDCPDFVCFKCGDQGHYARECTKKTESKCIFCNNVVSRCVCNEEDETSSVEPEAGPVVHCGGGSREDGSEAGNVYVRKSSDAGVEARPFVAAESLGRDIGGAPRLDESHANRGPEPFTMGPGEEVEEAGLVMEPGDPMTAELGPGGTPDAEINPTSESEGDQVQCEDMEFDQLPAAQPRPALPDFPLIESTQEGPAILVPFLSGPVGRIFPGLDNDDSESSSEIEDDVLITVQKKEGIVKN